MNLNTLMYMGRLIKDPIPIDTKTGTAFCRFTLACDRPKTKNNPEPGADFVSFKAFGQQAEFLVNYFHKGDTIFIERGHIATGSYEKDGETIYTTDLVADRIQGQSKQGRSESDEYLSNMGDFEENRAKNRNRDKLESSIGIEPDDLPFY